MKTKLLILLFVPVVIFALLLGCAGPAPTATTPAATTPGSTASPTAAPAWSPTKYITWIIMNAPGTSFDIYARAVAPVMKKFTGQDIVIKNVIGAGGLVALLQFYRSKPDGYTIGLIDTERRTSESILAKQEYNIDDIGWVGALNAYYGNPAVAADSPFKTVDDIKKESEKRVIKIPLADVAPYEAIAPQILGWKQVSYVTGFSGSIDAVLSMVKGEADVTFYGETTYLDYLKAGRVRVLLHGGPTESPIFKAAGYTIPYAGKDFSELTKLVNVRALAVPPGTPANIKAYYEDLLKQSLADPGLQKWSQETFMPAWFISSQELATMKKNMTDLWVKYKDILVKYGVK